MRHLILGALAMIAGLAAGPATGADLRFTLTENVTGDQITWLLPESPTPSYFVDGVLFELAGPFDGEFSDGSPTFFSGFAFYTADFGGGFETDLFDFDDFFFLALVGPQLFTGTTEAPTFRQGVFLLEDNCRCFSNFGELTLAIETAAVPEPASWALMILGFGAAGATLRQRRRFAARAPA